MQKFWLFSLIIGLGGCSIPPFKPTAFNEHINLTVVIDDDLSWTKKGYGKWKVVGMAHWSEKNCTIWIPSIESLDDENWRVIGKEVGHCIWEDYHKGIVDIY